MAPKPAAFSRVTRVERPPCGPSARGYVLDRPWAVDNLKFKLVPKRRPNVGFRHHRDILRPKQLLGRVGEKVWSSFNGQPDRDQPRVSVCVVPLPDRWVVHNVCCAFSTAKALTGATAAILVRSRSRTKAVFHLRPMFGRALAVRPPGRGGLCFRRWRGRQLICYDLTSESKGSNA